jgi:hypothetical protein
MSNLNHHFDNLLINDGGRASFFLDGACRDDHPEPQLLALLVGKEFDGRMIPSSSTILLLLLLHQPDAPKVTRGFNAPPLAAAPIDRKLSMNNIPSRHLLTHFKRLPQSQTQPPLLPPLQAPPPAAYASAAPMPIARAPVVPDSPNLDPTLLGGLPLRFWLLLQTPPRSLAGSFNGRPLHHLQPMMIPERSNYIAAPHKKLAPGDASPTLNPVLTPVEETPMTPLYLSQHREEYFESFVREDDMNQSK